MKFNCQFCDHTCVCFKWLIKHMWDFHSLSQIDLKDFIGTTFSGSPVKLPEEYLIQYFDKDLQEFMDLDDFMLLETNRKIKIVPVINITHNESLSRSLNESCSSAPSEKTNDSLLSNINQSLPDMGVAEVNNESLVHDGDENVTIEEPAHAGSSSFSSCNVGTSESWPHPFVIRDNMIRPATLKLLQEKVKLSVADTTSLFSSVLDEVINYTYYPTAWQYTDLTMAVLVKWPYLMKAYPTEMDAKWAWKKKLREFFRNTRKRKCSELPEIIAKKAKFHAGSKKEDAGENEPPTKKANIWGVKNHLPASAPGEDERTMEMHRQTIAKQYSVHAYNRKSSLLHAAMEKTFSWRRTLIVNDSCSVAELLDKFPLLKEPQQLLDEFKRLTELDIDVHFHQHFIKNAAKIITFQPPKQHSNENLLTKMKSYETTREDNYALSMLLLPYLLREDATNLFRNFGEKNFVQIICDGNIAELTDVVTTGTTYRISIDGNETDATNSLIEALEVVFALYYIFNLEYPKPLESFFIFIQKYIVKLLDTAAPNSKVLKLITKLQ